MKYYNEWIEQIDIDIDYYSAFLKSWIAFNSWYNSELGNVSDRVAIEELKTGDNKAKNIIINLLNVNGYYNEDPKSEIFRNALDNLNISLTRSTLTTQQRTKRSPMISFNSIAYNNSKTDTGWKTCYNKEVRANRTRAGVCFGIRNPSNKEIEFELEQEMFDYYEIERHPDFKEYNIDIQIKALGMYKSIHPFVFVNVMDNGDDPFVVGNSKFVKDEEKISAGIIEILYLVRCSLIHGNVQPNDAALEVYKWAYTLLHILMKKI
jgi:hypothetical protein